MWNCACCGRILQDRAIENTAVTEGGEQVSVGSDCAKKIIAAGAEGHAHENGDVLYSLKAFEHMED